MNVTELARKLKMPTKDLLDMLPAMGFDIGRRAIKINDTIAQRIIKEWNGLLAKYQAEQKKARAEKKLETLPAEKKKIAIPDFITIKELAAKMEIPVTRVLTELMRNGILSSMNEKIDFDTASIIGSELGIEIEKSSHDALADESISKTEIISASDQEHLQPRPPVVVIMGHVDHGKTKLLDTIRKTNVAGSESGGITQHIGAYQIIRKNKPITFIDTPGHEAFTTMRSRGAKVADIAILVIAADDGIKPQTKESIRIIQSGNIPMIVAINKIDKPEANIEKVKQELASINLLPEDWGGKTITVPISAKQGKGIDDLLDTIVLVSEMEKDKIVANPERTAVGTIIESRIDKGEGPIATVLVQNGTLRKGDLIFIQDVFYGKTRSLKNFLGQEVTDVPPSLPVKIIGLKGIPAVGDILEVKNEVDRKSRVNSYQLKTQAAAVYTQTQKTDKKKTDAALNLIIRTDVLGSLEAIVASIDKLQHPDIQITIVGKGVGSISESDVLAAEANQAVIMGFHVVPTSAALNLALEKNIEIKKFKIIYELLDEIKKLMEEKIKPETIKVPLGKIKVLKVFRTDKNSQIIGGKITEGKAVLGCSIDVYKNDELAASGRLVKLQSNKTEVKDLLAVSDCGIQYEGKPLIEPGDRLDLYKSEVQYKKIV